MNEKYIEIKERKNDLITKGIIYLVLMIFSLLVALFPYLNSNVKDIKLYFFIIGGIMFLTFTVMFVFLLFKQMNPDTAMTLNTRGFVDKINVGESILVEWTNVASIKLLGKKENPMLGITLENPDIVTAKMKKKFADDMRDNIEDNLPMILIPQSDVRIRISELKNIMINYVKETRTFENCAPKKPKNNPFTTEDVLRAFGQLPTEDEESAETNPKTSAEAEEKHSETNSSETPDAFYRSLQEQSSNDIFTDIASVTAETETASSLYEENNEDESIKSTNDIESYKKEQTDEEMPDEIKAILSRAKSSKISEIGKFLNDKDSPVTYQYNVKENKTTAGNDDVAPCDEPIASLNNEENNCNRIESAVEETDDEPTIESLIELSKSDENAVEPSFEQTSEINTAKPLNLNWDELIDIAKNGYSENNKQSND